LGAASLWVLVHQRVRGFTLTVAAFSRWVCAPVQFQPLCARNAGFYVFPDADSNRHPPIPRHPNHLQVIIDIQYQYAIIVSLHDSSVPCKPCATPRGPSNPLWRWQLFFLVVPSYWYVSATYLFRFSLLRKHRGCVGYSSHSGTYTPPVTPLILVLSFHAFPDCKFRNSFLLTYRHWMGGVHLSSFHRGAK